MVTRGEISEEERPGENGRISDRRAGTAHTRRPNKCSISTHALQLINRWTRHKGDRLENSAASTLPSNQRDLSPHARAARQCQILWRVHIVPTKSSVAPVMFLPPAKRHLNVLVVPAVI